MDRASTEAATQSLGMDRDVIWRYTKHIHRNFFHLAWELTAHPDFETVRFSIFTLFKMGCAVHGFHTYMRDIWELVVRLDRLISFVCQLIFNRIITSTYLAFLRRSNSLRLFDHPSPAIFGGR